MSAREREDNEDSENRERQPGPGPGPTTRVLIVDDSAAACSLIRWVLGRDPLIDVVGQCRSGEEALSVLDDLAPDLVTLDVEMPGLGGLETLRRIRERDRYLPVIMFSTLTLTGARATLDALALGADDYASKPTGASSPEEALAAVAHDLLPKVNALAARRRWRVQRQPGARRAARHAPGAADVATVRPMAVQRTYGSSGQQHSPGSVIALGASTGGPEALSQILPGLAGDLSVPVLVVQHMPALFTSLLAERLDRASRLTVREARDREPLEPGCVYIAPGDRHLTVARRGGRVAAHLDDEPKLHYSRPAVDRLFQSLPAAYGDGVVAVVLTGMGRDGVDGCQAIRSVGGRVVVQDEESSAVWGMGGAVVAAGLASATIGLDQISAYVTRAVRR